MTLPTTMIEMTITEMMISINEAPMEPPIIIGPRSIMEEKTKQNESL